jgi:hypothetical protein
MNKTNVRKVNKKNRMLTRKLNILFEGDYYFEYEYTYDKEDIYVQREYIINIYKFGQKLEGVYFFSKTTLFIVRRCVANNFW